MNDDLVRAINEKRLVRFVYRIGAHRIVEPHDYGIMNGVEWLLGYPVSGESQSGARMEALRSREHSPLDGDGTRIRRITSR